MGVPAPATSRAITDHLAEVVDRAVELQWDRWPGLRESFSETQIQRTIEDTTFHTRHIAAAIYVGEPALTQDYLCWNVSLFRHLNIPVEWLEGSLADVTLAIREVVGDEAGALAGEYLDTAGISALADCADPPSSFISPTEPRGALANRYLGSLLARDRHEAANIILGALNAGTSVDEVYLEILQPVLREVGRLWQNGTITVAQEHYSTAMTQMIMSQTYPFIFDTPRGGHRLVAGCVGSELHEVGARMVADLFEYHGWDTYYIGANNPTAAIIESVVEFGAEVLALSATMGFHARMVEEVIRAVRADTRCANTIIIVGGLPFNVAPNLWRAVGADGWSPDALSAIDLANRMLDQKGAA